MIILFILWLVFTLLISAGYLYYNTNYKQITQEIVQDYLFGDPHFEITIISFIISFIITITITCQNLIK